MLKIGHVVKQCVVVILANLTVLHMGLAITWPSPVLIKLRNESQTSIDRVVTDEEASWIVSISPLSGAFVIFVSGFIMDYFGRKAGLLMVLLPRTVMYLLYIFATQFWMISLGRAVSGVADSITVSVLPTYASEMASKEVRGALGTITQILSAIGMMVTLTVGPYVSYFNLNLLCLCITVVISVPLFFLPETPYYLYSKGRIDEALKILIEFRGSEILVEEEIKEYSMNANIKVYGKEVLKDKTVLKSVVLVVFLGIGYQITGANAVSLYLQTIFQTTKTNINPELSSAIIGCIQLLGCLFTILLTDRFGRKPILTGSLIGMALGMTGLGVFFKHFENGGEVTGFMNYLPLISLILEIFCCSAGLGSMYWMLLAELFDGPARAMGVTISASVTGMGFFLITKYFEAIIGTIGAPTIYWLFGGNCILTCLFVSFFIPETKGKSFAEIQAALGRKEKKANDIFFQNKSL